MPTLAYPLADVIARLEAADAIKLVGTGPDLLKATQTPPRTAPAVFVLSETRGSANKFTGPLIQQDRETFVKLRVWVRNHGSPLQARGEMDAVLASIETALAGWTPSNPPFGALSFVAARDELDDGAYLVVQVIYVATWTFSKQQEQ